MKDLRQVISIVCENALYGIIWVTKRYKINLYDSLLTFSLVHAICALAFPSSRSEFTLYVNSLRYMRRAKGKILITLVSDGKSRLTDDIGDCS
jgi:hypothetical protein